MRAKTEADDERGAGIQVIARAASILHALSTQPDGMSLGEIANQVDLPRSTVQRIVGALEAEGLVRNEGAGGIGLGAGLFRLISSAHADLVSVARPWLRKLSESLSETVVLSRPSRLHLIVEHRIVADRELQVVPRLGLINMPLYGTSAGRALLALDSNEEVCRLIGDAADPSDKPPHLPGILRQLDLVREYGYAFDGGEIMEGITTMAVAIDSLLGRFAVSCPVPTIRFDKYQQRYLDELVKCKTGLLKDIGIARP